MRTVRASHQKRLDIVKILAEFRLGHAEIAQILVVSRHTIQADLNLLGILCMEPRDAKARFPRLVSVYAELVLNGCIVGRDELGKNILAIVKYGLEIVLCVPEIHAALEGAVAVLEARSLDARAEPYRQLIASIFGVSADIRVSQKPKKFFEEYLLRLHRKEVSLCDSFDALRDQILAAYLAQEAERTMPHLTDKAIEIAIQVVDEALATLSPKEERIVQLHYGLKGKPQKLKEVGIVFGVSRERIRQMVAQALRKLKHPSRSSLLRGLASSSSQLLEMRLMQATRMKREMKAEKLAEQMRDNPEVTALTSAQLLTLATPIDEYPYLYSSYCKDANIKYIGDLVEKQESDLLDMGVPWWEINRLKRGLAEFKLSLTMSLDANARQAYEMLKS